MKSSITGDRIYCQMWNTGMPCHPLWRLVAINCLMFHARTDNISPMRGVSDDVCFRKLFFPKAHTNSRRTKFTFTWERFASHAYECTRNVFPIFFFPPDNQSAPNFSATASALRAVTHVVCGKIFTLWSALCPGFEREWKNKNGSEILWAHRLHFYRVNGLSTSAK